MSHYCIKIFLITLAVSTTWTQNPPPPLFPTAAQILTDFLTVPVSTLDAVIDRVTTTGVLPLFYNLVSPVYNTVGRVQCSNAGGMFSFPIFRMVMADPKESYKSIKAAVKSKNRTGRQIDFGGNYACPGTCAGGTCVPYSNMTTAPSSLSYFRCACPETSCTGNGPIFQYATIVQGTTIRCDPYEFCTCSGLDPSTSYKGFMCSWMNLQINQTVFVQYSLPAQLAPVRWCACCAQAPGTPVVAATPRPIVAG